MSRLLIALLVLLWAGPARAELPAEGWSLGPGAERIRQSSARGEWVLSLTGTEKEPDSQATRKIAIPAQQPFAATFSCMLRIDQLPSWQDGSERVAFEVLFLDSQGREIGTERAGEWQKKVKWRPWAASVPVPAEAVEMEIRLHLKGAGAQAFFDEIHFLWNLPDDFERENWIVDGGFEYVNPKSAWETQPGQKILYPGREGLAALKIEQKKSGSGEGTSQSFSLQGISNVRQVSFALWVQPEDVQPEAEGGGAQAKISFYDKTGKPAGDPAVMGPWTGTSAWKQEQKEISIPAGAVSATLTLGLERATGAVSFDSIKLSAAGSQGPLLRPLESRTDLSDWSEFTPLGGSLSGPLDASGLLDGPAGKHGFLMAKGEEFQFQDGTPVRFWGVNLDGAPCFPEHSEAERLAERLAQLGVNLVRLHHLDAPWVKPNIFDSTREDTRHLSDESLDRLDFLIAQLKQRGIYLYLDLLTSRKFKTGDQVPAAGKLSRGAKFVSQFDRRLIQLQKEYAKNFLTHLNPYTKKRYLDDPAVALIEIVNESSLCRFKKGLPEMPDPYERELAKLWEKSGGKGDDYREVGSPQTQQFYTELQRKYFKEMHEFLRGLGLKIPIAGSNFGLEGADLLTNAELDFVERHSYWDPPLGAVDGIPRFGNRNLIEEAGSSNPVVRLGSLQAAGKPFVMGEWNVDWPNEFRAVGPLLMAAYGSFQGADGVLLFSYNGNLEPKRLESLFDVSTKPEIFLQMPSVARLFHRQDVRPASAVKNFPVRPDSVPPGISLAHAVRRGAEESSGEAELPNEGTWASDTGELRWDFGAGRVTLDTPRSQGVAGRMGSGKIKLTGSSFDLHAPFACLLVNSLESVPVSRSGHLLLTVVARSENSGMVYNATRTLLRSRGEGPVRMEPVTGSFRLERETDLPVRAFALDAGGRRIKEVPVRRSGKNVEVPLGASPLIEIVFGEKE